VDRTRARERILAATVRTLAQEGYARTTARAIARAGAFAPGVIYYHFADLDDLFVATVQFTSQARLQRYRAEIDGVSDATELVRRLRTLYAEDSAEGHIAAVQELVAATTTAQRLAEQVRLETARWQSFAENVIDRFVSGTPLASLVPVREAATAIIGAYLGIEMLSHLDPDRTDPDALFDAAERAAALFETFRPW
jgi:AcrR family transcriptional regulator